MAYKLGVLGKDIGYSLSPKIHQEFAKQHNYPIEYLIYDIDKDPVNFVHEFFDNEGFGLNITKPFKHIVAKEFNPDVESINCIYGKGTKACSTDGAGLLNDLESKKALFFEKTNSKHKLILPYASPLQHINHICQKSQSIHHISGNYLFFENINGFHYRSLQSLTNKSDGEPRVNVNGFVYSPKRPHITYPH